MIQRLKNIWTASIKRQLILGIAFVHAVMMSFFVYDLVQKQQNFLTKQHQQKTISLAKTLASTSTSWVLANDFIGLQEVITSIKEYPGMKYVFITDTQGHILAHTQKEFIGKYISDSISIELLKSESKAKTIYENKNFIDVASPILREKQLIGWVRIALNKDDINSGLYAVTIDGIIYTLLAIIVGVLFAYLISLGLIKGIDTIIATIKQTKHGDQNARSNLQRNDEIGILSREFDIMLQKLLDNNALINSVIDSSPDLIFYKDYYNFDGMYIGCNKAFSEFVGKNKEDIIGKTDLDLFEKDVAEFFRSKDKAMLELKQTSMNEEWVTYPNKAKVLLETLKTPLYNFDNTVLGVLGLSRNITEKHNVQKELANKNKLLFEQAKLVEMGEMISNIAHQWRQPLSIISTAATGTLMEKQINVLKDDDLEKKLKLINDNAQYLSQTIDTFRDYIRERKEYKEVILQDRIKIALNIVQASLDNNYIKLEHNLDTIEPIAIKLVVGELSEVIINIINNAKDALKQTQPKDPCVRLNVEKLPTKVFITIDDNGGGIKTEHLPKIFEPYFTTKHQSVGTGLGLHMSYKIITESLKGKLSVENTDVGAKFIIELPL